jgi:archaeosortase A (PGF-CTERM-specific)
VTLIRAFAAIDALFLATMGSLLAAAVSYRLRDARAVARPLAVLGWALATVFWVLTTSNYLATGRSFLGLVGLVTVVVAGYTTTLVARDRQPGVDLTVAFAVMAICFLPFQFVEPIHRFVLDTVAGHTAWVLSLAGFAPLVGAGPAGYANVIYFAGQPATHSIRIVSACTGISAIALFAGLVVATRADPRRRIATAVAVGALIYALNIARAVFVAGALAGRWFAFATGPAGAVFGTTDPALVSYYVAEYLLAQVLVVVVLLWVYARLADRLPELQSLVDGFLSAAATDIGRLSPRS